MKFNYVIKYYLFYFFEFNYVQVPKLMKGDLYAMAKSDIDGKCKQFQFQCQWSLAIAAGLRGHF